MRTRSAARRFVAGSPAAGIALVMVLLVLMALAAIGTPFVISMALQERSSQNFDGRIRAQKAAEAARNHAIGHLTRTVRALEAEEQATESGILTRTRKGLAPARRRDLRRARRSTRRRRQRGMVIREDIHGKRARRSRPFRRSDRGSRAGSSRNDSMDRSSSFAESRKGPSSSSFDTPQELTTTLPGSIEIPANAPRLSSSPGDATTTAPDAAASTVVSYQDLRGITATARAIDEQGKINLNTAPPGLLANLFGVSVLEASLRAGDGVLVLEDASVFQSDGNSETLDGAVVVVHRLNGTPEAITYRDRRGNELRECFRGAFFSIPPRATFPAGSLVYDLRGWKIGYHRLRAGAIAGFASARLTEFPTVEAVREIADWQIASLFLGRFRGEGITAEFLARNGIRLHQLEKLGLDPSFLEDGSSGGGESILEDELDAAVKILRHKKISRSFVDRLKKARGVRAVITLAAQIGPLGSRGVEKLRKQVEAVIERSARKLPKLSREYLEACLEDLAEVYRTPGVETIRPEDLKLLRQAVTVSSTVPTPWSEAQVCPDQILAGSVTGESFRVARPGPHGGGAIVQISSRANPRLVEYNQTTFSGKGIPAGGFQLLFPVTHSYGENDAVLRFLQRHPVNINTASERVLRAVFTGVSGYERRFTKRTSETAKRSAADAPAGTPGVVTPREAVELARRIVGQSFKGPRDFFDALVTAAESSIDADDIRPLFINSLEPNHYMLRVGTTGFCYDSGDVYTIESRGILRDLAGAEITHAALREIVEVSPPRPIQWTLFTQQDFTSELYLQDPLTDLAPEDHFFHGVTLPGIRSHLVRTTPIMAGTRLIVPLGPAREGGAVRGKGQSIISFPVPGAENGTLRLANAETMRSRFTRELEHFRETSEGLELPGGDPHPVDIGLEGGGGGTGRLGSGPGGGRGGGGQGTDVGGGRDLTGVPASVEAWVRFRTFPEETNHEGFYIIMDAGVEEERNRITLLYDSRNSEWIARIYDSSIRDPSIPEGKQYFQVRARRPLDLDTWYHVRLAWEGAFSGGVQLFIDGMPVGVPNYVAELRSTIAPTGGGSVSFKPLDPQFRFPTRGVVRINNETFEYRGSAIRQQAASNYMKWRQREETRVRAIIVAQNAPAGSQPGLLESAAGPARPTGQQTRIMRGPWNQRANAPANHAVGSTVSLHGYTLEIGHKIERFVAGGGNQGNQGGGIQERQASGAELVWGRGGLAVAEALLPWNFPPGPPEVVWINDYHHQPLVPAMAGGAGGGGTAGAVARVVGGPADGYIAPVFQFYYSVGEFASFQNVLSLEAYQNLIKLDNALKKVRVVGPGRSGATAKALRVRVFAAALKWSGQGRSQYLAADFFQSRGVLISGDLVGIRRIAMANSAYVRYRKEALPGGHPALQATSLEVGPDGFIPLDDILLEPVLMGLRIDGAYPSGPVSNDALHLRQPDQRRQGGRTPAAGTGATGFSSPRELYQVSLLAGGPVAERYSQLGVLEIRGAPAPWNQPLRPDLSGGPLSPHHPDDTVSWFRYDQIEGNMFIGYNRYYSFRGYPETDRYLKNQMLHRRGAAIRQVMELKNGGAGFGDYVSISTDDPQVVEPRVRMVYNATERQDGRFFVSLIDVDPESGVEIPGLNLPYRFNYTADTNPRLVKFPSGNLPQVGGGKLLFFGDVVEATGGVPGVGFYPDDIEEEIETGFVLDEIHTQSLYGPSASAGGDIRHVVVPFESGTVRRETLGNGLMNIGGSIPRERTISRGNPLDILVVSVGRDHLLFAGGIERGVLRINDELFYFEDPNASEEGNQSLRSGASGRSAGHGTLTGVGGQPSSAPQAASNAAFAASSGGLRRFDDRMRVTPRIATAGLNGHFEPQGFARIDTSRLSLLGFYEVFYYERLGGGFTNCLRGQFNTAIIRARAGDPVSSASVRLRLIGRGLLGTEYRTHGFGDRVGLVTGANVTEITGPLTDTGLPVVDTTGFPNSGYLLIDAMRPAKDFEIIAYKGKRGENLFARPRDEAGKGILRSCFGTIPRAIGQQMFAYAIPFRHFDRYEPEVESEDLAYFQKAFRVRGARWRKLSWRERWPKTEKERLCDIVVAVRFDGSPQWSVKASNRPGGLWLLEAPDGPRGDDTVFDLDVAADELEIRVYFRYRTGSFRFVTADHYADDWKETPVLDSLTVEYEKAGRILRHEETDF